MCKAHVLRFCCGHGVLMGFELCKLGPCPILKTTGVKLPQQPYKCYKCQSRLSTASRRPTSGSCSSSGSIESTTPVGASPITPPGSPMTRVDSRVPAPLPGVARQPSDLSDFSRTFSRTSTASSCWGFSFSCSSSSHYPAPHYVNLPTFLPHQDHPCPPCQLEALRAQTDREAASAALAQYPHLTTDMLVRNGRTWEEWQSKPTLDEFVEERRSDERQMWLHVTRKWTQDLKKVRVLVAEEDGLGLHG